MPVLYRTVASTDSTSFHLSLLFFWGGGGAVCLNSHANKVDPSLPKKDVMSSTYVKASFIYSMLVFS
jgi:hypothetical protein